MSQLQLSSLLRSPHDHEGPSLLNLGLNLEGTDYFVGDLHGEGRLLNAALQHIGINWKHDRLIAVGDLVDRGPSHAELFTTIFGQPHFYSVLGNHDVGCWRQIQQYMHFGLWPKTRESNWLGALERSDIFAIRKLIRRLPLTIQLRLRNGLRVGIVHADVPQGLASSSELTNISRRDLPSIPHGSVIHALLMSRRRAQIAGDILLGAANDHPPPDYSKGHRLLDVGSDLDLMICGHSVCWTFRPVQAGKWMFIDTGAGYSRHEMPDAALSVVDPINRRVVQASYGAHGIIRTSEFTLDDPIPVAPTDAPSII